MIKKLREPQQVPVNTNKNEFENFRQGSYLLKGLI